MFKTMSSFAMRVAFELYDATANVGFRTIFDGGDALYAALRLVAACIRLRRLMTP